MLIGHRIRARRKEIGISVKELAKRAGLAASTLYDLERGDSDSTTRLPEIAEHLRVHARWLSDGSGPKLLEDGHVVREPPVPYSKYTQEAIFLANEIAQLPDALRKLLTTIVEVLVAREKVAEREVAKAKRSGRAKPSERRPDA